MMYIAYALSPAYSFPVHSPCIPQVFKIVIYLATIHQKRWSTKLDDYQIIMGTRTL
jgi:hypothetical protein